MMLLRPLSLMGFLALSGAQISTHFPWPSLRGAWVQAFSTRHVQTTSQIDWRCVWANIDCDDGKPNGTRAVNLTVHAWLHNVRAEPVASSAWSFSSARRDTAWEFVANGTSPHAAARYVLDETFRGPTLPILLRIAPDNYSMHVLVRREALDDASWADVPAFLEMVRSRFGFTGRDRELLSSFSDAACGDAP